MATGTKNLNTLPSGGAMQATDIIQSNGFAASHLVTYMADETSSINNSSIFFVAPLSTGKKRDRTGTQVKAYINGSTALIKDTDLFVVTRSNLAYKVTALEVKTFAPGSVFDLEAPSLDWVVVQKYHDASSVTTSGSPDLRLRTAADQSTSGVNDFAAAEADAPLYYVDGGPNNKGRIKVDPTHIIDVAVAGMTTSPFSLYLVMKLPSLSDGDYGFYYNVISGAAGLRISAPQLAMYLYTGAGDFAYNKSGYSTAWMVVSVRVKTSTLAYIRINRSPEIPVNITGGDTSNVISYIRGNFTDNEYSEIRAASRMHTEVEFGNILNALTTFFAITPPANSMIVMGDSHSVGIAATALNRYTELVAAGKGFTIFNLAVSGSTIRDFDYPQSGGLAFADLIDYIAIPLYNYCSVIISYGTNDAAVFSSQGVTIAQWKTAVKADCQKLLAAGFTASKIYMHTPPYSTGAYVNGFLDDIRTPIMEICSELGFTLVDNYTDVQTAGQNFGTIGGGDGIHGNNPEHITLANSQMAAMP